MMSCLLRLSSTDVDSGVKLTAKSSSEGVRHIVNLNMKIFCLRQQCLLAVSVLEGVLMSLII
jgi:hypothetical protein